MRNKDDWTKPIIATFIVAFIMTAMLITYYKNRPTPIKGSKHVIVTVNIPDERPYEYEVYTDAEYLGKALKDTNFIKGETTELGFYITEVKGRVADDSRREWWCITKDGEDVYTGVDEIPVNDGDKFEFTLKTY
jgi:hypothetical protein